MIDFAVIGGGIAGASAAAHLAPHGSVALFEMEPSLAYHTSGRSAAMLVENYGSAGSRSLVHAARPFLENPPEHSVDAPLLSPRPLMWVAPAERLETLQATAKRDKEHRPDSEVLTGKEVVDHMPLIKSEWVAGGILETSGADIDVAALHQAYVRIARSNDAEILTTSPVTALERSSKGWTVRSGDQTMVARAVLNAAGAWGDRIAELGGIQPLGLQPMRRTAFMVPGKDTYAHLPMVVHVDEDWYLRPDGVQFLCSLAEEVPSEPMDAKPRMEDVALAIDRINEATNIGIRTVNSQWCGLRTFAPDRELVIGGDPTAPGFFWLVGQGGIGIQTSPAYGALIASLVTGSDLSPALQNAGVDPERTSPARFR